MSSAPTSKEVITLIEEWIEAKKQQDNKPTPASSSGGFGLFSPFVDWSSDGGAGDHIEDDDKTFISPADQKLIRAQMALDLYVTNKVEETLQAIINQSNQRHSGPRPQHELYPERG